MKYKNPLTINLGRWFGPEIIFHWSFVLFFSFLLYVFYKVQDFYPLYSIIAIYASVVAHEFGHILAAKYYKIPSESITITPLGGLARIEEIPRDSEKEFYITIFGPIVNFIIAFFIIITIAILNMFNILIENHYINILNFIIHSNLVLAIFNLIPAIPMDGGRILRSLLFRKYSYEKSTEIAVVISLIMVFLMFILAVIFVMPMLLFIAFYIGIAAIDEIKRVRFENKEREQKL